MKPSRRWLVAGLMLLAACSNGDGGREQVQRLATGDDITDAQTACILERLESEFDLVLDDLGAELSAEEEQTVAIARDVCLLDPNDAAGSPDGAEPQGEPLPSSLASAPSRFDPDDPPPGDDEALDALWEGCGDGDARACDELLFTATPGSDYEAFAFSCGGRENLRCSSLLGEEGAPGELSPATQAPGDDPIFDRWWEQCAAGSARACDQLLLIAPGGSDYYNYGNTCGGRAVGYCTQLLGDDGLPPILEKLRPTDLPPGDDELLDEWWAACGLRNPDACANLFEFAPYGSLYERFGISCGGRAVAPCERFFLDEAADEVERREEEAARRG